MYHEITCSKGLLDPSYVHEKKFNEGLKLQLKEYNKTVQGKTSHHLVQVYFSREVSLTKVDLLRVEQDLNTDCSVIVNSKICLSNIDSAERPNMQMTSNQWQNGLSCAEAIKTNLRHFRCVSEGVLMNQGKHSSLIKNNTP